VAILDGEKLPAQSVDGETLDGGIERRVHEPTPGEARVQPESGVRRGRNPRLLAAGLRNRVGDRPIEPLRSAGNGRRERERSPSDRFRRRVRRAEKRRQHHGLRSVEPLRGLAVKSSAEAAPISSRSPRKSTRFKYASRISRFDQLDSSARCDTELTKLCEPRSEDGAGRPDADRSRARPAW
jgi:hypothetical protein